MPNIDMSYFVDSEGNHGYFKDQTARDQISRFTTPTLIWQGDATTVGNTYNMTGNYTDYKYLLVLARTNVERKKYVNAYFKYIR